MTNNPTPEEMGNTLLAVFFGGLGILFFICIALPAFIVKTVLEAISLSLK